jgi:hypothetical protein
MIINQENIHWILLDRFVLNIKYRLYYFSFFKKRHVVRFLQFRLLKVLELRLLILKYILIHEDKILTSENDKICVLFNNILFEFFYKEDTFFNSKSYLNLFKKLLLFLILEPEWKALLYSRSFLGNFFFYKKSIFFLEKLNFEESHCLVLVRRIFYSDNRKCFKFIIDLVISFRKLRMSILFK